jgi:poly(beta-D-mannuronate) lyase
MNGVENPELNKYWQVKNATIKNNVIVNCTEAIAIGSVKSTERIIPPINIVLEDIVIINPVKVINFYDQPLQSTIQNNEVIGGTIADGFF